MKVEIKHRYSGVLWSGEAEDLREGLQKAIAAKVNLRGADLSGSNLSGSNLSDSNLSDSNLSDSNLSGAESGSVCRLDFGGWSICIRADKTSIGCQTQLNIDWLKWTPKDVAPMDDKAEAWWKLHGPAVKAAIRVVMEKARVK